MPAAGVKVAFAPMTEAVLDAVLALEQQAHQHPWQRRHFADCLASGYPAQLLLAGDALLGYFVAMPGFEEAHLLNMAVAPAYQGQGWAQLMLDALVLWARGQGLQWLWLEVRPSNARALRLYQGRGFQTVGQRKGYYPATHGQREDALVMRLALHDPAAAHIPGVRG